MEFLKMIKFRKPQQSKNQNFHSSSSSLDQPQSQHEEEPKDLFGEITTSKQENDDDDDDDDDDDGDGDFLMAEVKRRLKELKRNTFMVHIPEEEDEDEDEDEDEQEPDQLDPAEPSSNEWRDVEAESRQLWSFFGAFYDNYCNRMLFFDRANTHLLNQISASELTPSPRSRSMSKKKLSSPLGCLSLKKVEYPHEDDDEHLQHQEEEEEEEEAENDPYLDLETSYVSQLCLTWEALHCQYTQLTHIINSHSETSKSYNHCAQHFQQFQVLLQRFIENEPFQPGLRPVIYAQTRNSFSKLLQVPNIVGQDRKEEEESDMLVHAPDLMRIIESSILTFHMFIKIDNKSNGVRNRQNQNQMATPLQQVQSVLDKRKMKLKELWKKRKGGKKKELLPGTRDEMELLLGLIDVKVVSRVLRMPKITKEQLFWSEEKIKKLHLSGKLQRDPSPILFPF